MRHEFKMKKPKKLLPPKNKKLLKKGSYSLALTIIVIAAAIFLNLLAGELPSSLTKIDVSENKLYTVGDQTKELASRLTEDVTLYLLAEEGQEDSTLNELLTRYADLSSHIKYEIKDPVLNPNFASQYTEEEVSENSIIVVSEKRSKVIPYSDLYESSINYQTYSMETTAFDGEGQVTSAIDYVTSEELPILYTLQGHEESELDSSMQSAVAKENIEIKSLNLITAGSVPEDASCIMINAPRTDISADEAEAILTYLKDGGRALLVSGYTSEDMPNFDSILSEYGVTIDQGVVLDGDSSHYISGNPLYLVPEIQSCDATGSLAGGGSYVLMPVSQSISTLDDKRDTVTVTDMLITSSSAYLKSDPENMQSLSPEDGDTEGTFTLAASISETTEDSEEETRMVLFTSGQLLNSETDAIVSGGNTKLLTNSLSWMCGHSSSVSIAAKSMELSYLTLTAASANMWSILTIAVIPAGLLLLGGFIWLKRRKQ